MGVTPGFLSELEGNYSTILSPPAAGRHVGVLLDLCDILEFVKQTFSAPLLMWRVEVRGQYSSGNLYHDLALTTTFDNMYFLT